MNTQQTAFFFEIQQIPEDSKIFDELQNQQVCFSYFQVNQKYYLFVYQQKFIDIDRIEPFIHILDELDTKQRKIRSLRGFFLYALEILENGQDYQILKTNLQPSFWRKLKTILRQNKKIVLLQFLFGKDEDNKLVNQGWNPAFDDRIQNLQNQINSLQQKIIELEQNQTLNFKKALNELLKRSQASKIDQQYNYTLKPNMGSSLQKNDTKINPNLPETKCR